MKVAKTAKSAHAETDYQAFDQLNGRHPWQESVPEGLILYPARQLPGGKVSYFNFELAQEMGLIPRDHPRQLNKKLSEKILGTFCLRIINEYDQEHHTRFARNKIKDGQYMATRYLQLQHDDKTGRTSGDGRCIWNGVIRHRGREWDVSSRGTGVTALAPGVVKAGKPLKSGNTDHGYGCGMAEIDELFGAAILAEIFHRNGIPTERVLAIVDLGKGVGIGVRAAPNLIRPAHLFLFLKQGKWEPLQRAADYFIEKQYANKRWPIKPDERHRYNQMLDQVTESFAKFVAHLDREYIFAWLDWDGDNVLADAGIIDYGSVRQFGLRHDQYRYDDVERFSTNLNEQRLKARQTVQTFAQMVDYLNTKRRKPIRHFAAHPCLKRFDRLFERFCLERFLFQMGFPASHVRVLMNRHRSQVEALFRIHSQLERTKTHKRIQKVADGIHRPAIFNMRKALALMPEYLYGLPNELTPKVEAREFFSWILSSQAGRKDRKLSEKTRRKIDLWQSRYLDVVKKVCAPATWGRTLKLLSTRAAQINHENRITGNALINIVDEILRYRRRGLSDTDIQAAIDQLIAAQTLNPDYVAQQPKAAEAVGDKSQRLMHTFLSVVDGYREDI